MFWLILFALLLIMAVGGTVYLFTRFHRFSFMEKFGEKHKVLSWLACLIPFGGLACFAFINVYTVIVVVLHLMIFWLIADIIAAIVRKIAKKSAAAISRELSPFSLRRYTLLLAGTMPTT